MDERKGETRRLFGDTLALLVLLGGIGDGESWGKRLLELLGLLRVLEDESVEVTVAADLELGLARDGALLDAGRGGVLAAADLNELLDVLDFLRHDGRCGIRRIWIVD